MALVACVVDLILLGFPVLQPGRLVEELYPMDCDFDRTLKTGVTVD